MSEGLKILKRGAVFISILCVLYSCATPEERTNEAKAKLEAATKSHLVVIQQMKFTPAEVTVANGDTITWINKDIVEHNVTEELNKEWASGKLQSGKSWSMVAVKNASYYCTIHPVMKGSVSIR